MRIYLTGFMGAGKTSVGKCLATALGYPFVDLDALVEAQAGITIGQIFERFREPAFRDLEHECLRRTEELDDAVIATGGGTIAFGRNLALLRRLGTSVWLDPSFTTLVERIGVAGGAERPLFRSPEQARELYQRRLPAYRQADLRVTVEPSETARQVADRIADELRGRQCDI